MGLISIDDALHFTLLFLATTGLFIPLISYLRIPQTLGFLLVGIVFGPPILGLLSERWPFISHFTFSLTDLSNEIANFGLAFVFFVIGLELSFSRLILLRRMVFGIGSFQFLGTSALFTATALYFGMDLAGALLASAALAMSSSVLIIPTIANQKKLNSSSGRTTFSILLFQDLAVSPILVIISLFPIGTSNSAIVTSIVSEVSLAILTVFGLFLGGQIALRPLFKWVKDSDQPEAFTAISLLIIICYSLIAEAAGTSMGVGAFIAGVTLSETEFRREVERTISPFRGLLVGLFFLTVGKNFDFLFIFEKFPLILGLLVFVLFVKFTVLYGILKFSKINRQSRIDVSLMLAPCGEFALLLLPEGVTSGILHPEAAKIFMLIVMISMFITPLIIQFLKILQKNRQEKKEPFDIVSAEAAKERVVVIGQGHVGRLVTQTLDRYAVPWISFDLNSQRVRALKEERKNVHYGDVSSRSFLRKFFTKNILSIVITLRDYESVKTIIREIKTLDPAMKIVVRAHDVRDVQSFYEIGALVVVPETLELSFQLVEGLLLGIGIPHRKSLQKKYAEEEEEVK